MKKKCISIMIMLVLMITLCTPASFAGSKKTISMTVYTQVIKNGNNAYCMSDAGIYAVDLETREVKCLDKNYDNLAGPAAIRFHKGYIYYLFETSFTDTYLYRVKASGGKVKKLAIGYKFVIKNNRIYYDRDGGGIKSMKFNGKSKKKINKYKLKMKRKKSNASGYAIKEYEETFVEYDDYEEEYYETTIVHNYLKTPSGEEIYLGDYESEE